MKGSQRVLAAFSEEQTAKLSGVSQKQLRYWDRTGFYSPTYAEINRRIAFSRVYSFKDIVALRVLHVLRNQYNIPLQHLRDVSERLGGLEGNPDRWLKTKLYPLNGRVVWHENGTDLPQEIASGQYVASIVLDDVVEKTRQSVSLVREPRTRAQIGSIEKSRRVAHNAAVIAGTRIPVSAIKNFAEAGYTTDQIILEYPDISPADVDAALRYKDKSAAA